MGSRRRSWLTGEGSRDCGRSETWIARCKVQGVLVMATKEDPAVNGHPGDESTGRQQGSEGRGNKGEQGPGRGKNESNAQNRPKSEPNCCLLENGKRCTRPAGNATYSKRIQATVAQKKLRLAMDPQPNTSTSASTTRMSSRRFGQRERGEKVRIAQRSSNNSRALAGPVQAILH